MTNCCSFARESHQQTASNKAASFSWAKNVILNNSAVIMMIIVLFLLCLINVLMMVLLKA